MKNLKKKKAFSTKAKGKTLLCGMFSRQVHFTTGALLIPELGGQNGK